MIDETRKCHLKDSSFGRLLGDYGEILYERSEFNEAIKYFEEGIRVFDALLKEMSYEPLAPNPNQKALNDGVQICEELMIPTEAEQEVRRKPEKAKGVKKEEKKGGVKDEKIKKDQKKQMIIQQDQKPEMKVKPINQMPEYDFVKESRSTYHLLDAENPNSMQMIHNSYNKLKDSFIKMTLRYMNCVLNLVKPEEKFPETFPDVFPDKLRTQFPDNFIQILRDFDAILSKNHNVSIAFKLEVPFLIARCLKLKFLNALYKIQADCKNKFFAEKNKKFKRLVERTPFRDLSRNVYLLDVPNFSQKLKEELVPLLLSSKASLLQCLSIIKGECLFYEFNRNPEEILMELSEVCLLLREYRPRVEYKYLDTRLIEEQLAAKPMPAGKAEKMDFNAQMNDLQTSDKRERLNLEL